MWELLHRFLGNRVNQPTLWTLNHWRTTCNFQSSPLKCSSTNVCRTKSGSADIWGHGVSKTTIFIVYIHLYPFKSSYHIYPQDISSPFTLKSQYVFLVPLEFFNLSNIFPFEGLRRWCCGCSSVPYPKLAMTNCSPRNHRSWWWRNWKTSSLPGGRSDPSSCWSYWKRRQGTWSADGQETWGKDR